MKSGNDYRNSDWADCTFLLKDKTLNGCIPMAYIIDGKCELIMQNEEIEQRSTGKLVVMEKRE